MTALILATAAALGATPRRIGGWSQVHGAANRPSIVNCTWGTFDQTIDHFGASQATFPQRYCLYDAWWRPGAE